jgi:NADH-quinone oxidoreductase subunit N
MDLHELVNELIVDAKGGAFASSSIGLFLPELMICLTICLLLLIRVLDDRKRISMFWVALIGTGLALVLAGPHRLFVDIVNPDAYIHGSLHSIHRVEIFTGMLVVDRFTVMMRSLLLISVLIFLVMTRLSGIPDKEDSADIYSLVLGATLGMCLMVSANHLLIIFLAIEMASLPSYVLAGMLKGRRTGSEAALKYSIYGAGTAGVMLYGISLICGLIGSAHLPTMAILLAEKLPTFGNGELMVLSLGGLMLGVGLAFKLSAVPFHFWCPDVFHGACAEVNSFLSVTSKAAALALLVRVAIGFGTVPPEGFRAGEDWTRNPVAVVAQRESDGGGLFAVEGQPETTAPAESGGGLIELEGQPETTAPAESGGSLIELEGQPETTAPAEFGVAESHEAAQTDEEIRQHRISALAPVRTFIGRLVALIAIISCTFGNLAAYGQTNIKRLLAYSTIAHAGYMMMAIPPLMELAGVDAVGAEQAVAGLLIYIVVYVFMNMGAFAVVAFIRNTIQSEEIADYRGLIRSSPGIAICFTLMLFSLVGLPPFSGFIGKFAIFASLVEGFTITGQRYLMVLLLIGGLNTALSLFYYLRVVKVMTLDDAPDPLPLPLPLGQSGGGRFVLLLTVPTALLILVWEPLSTCATSAALFLIQRVPL